MRPLVFSALLIMIATSAPTFTASVARAKFEAVAGPPDRKAACPTMFSKLKAESHSSSEVMVEVAKSRRLERLKFAGRPTYRASDESVIEVRSSYPKIAQSIDSFTEKLKLGKFKSPAEEIYELPGLSSLHNPELARMFGFEVASIDPKAAEAAVRVFNRLNDVNAFQMHTRALAEDAAVEMLRMKDRKSLEALSKGELTSTAVLRVLVKRQKAKGEKVFKTLKEFVSASSDNPDEFLEAVARGPFFDKAFKNDEHTMAAHLLQRDFVDDVIWEATQGQPKIFWNFAADAKSEGRVWDNLFDHGGKQGLNDPEEYARRVDGLLKLKFPKN